MIDIIALITSHTLVVILILILSVLPLYFAIKLVGGETGIVRIILVSLILSFASAGATRFISIFAGIFMLIATLFVYQMAFKLSLLKAFIAWILQYVFVLIAISLFVFVLAITI
jgi:hypothetical protein